MSLLESPHSELSVILHLPCDDIPAQQVSVVTPVTFCYSRMHSQESSQQTGCTALNLRTSLGFMWLADALQG